MRSIVDPYGKLTGGQWLRGNLHTHSNRSDGARPQQSVIDEYASRGHGFLMFSDHDILTSEADLAPLDNRGMILLPGNEISFGGPHLLHVDADRRIQPGRTRQEILNDIVAATRETGRGFAIVNHPNWQQAFDHCTLSQMLEWWGYLGMEIYNGVIGRLEGSSYALDKWDMLLSVGRRVWGFANDDSHAAEGDTGLGWNVAYVKEKTVAGVIEALRAGRFYASTGVEIKSIRVDGLRIRIDTSNAQRIVAVHNSGQRIAVADAPSIDVQVPTRSRYVRFECWGPGEQMAWTQPFFVEEDDTVTDEDNAHCIPQWRVSNLAAGMDVDHASPAHAASLATVTVRSITEREKGLYGFADARPQIRGQSGLVYLSADITADADRRGVLYLGYDGPIRIWLNDREVFDGPGTNPAVRDRLALHASFRKGVNRLVIAFGTNKGKAWGLFGRVEWSN
jgi:hypothetical protein